MIIGSVIQQPQDVLDYDVDYSTWFGDDTDSVTSVDVTIKGPDEMLVVTGQLSGNNIVKLWIQGGTDGESYTVELTTTMHSGRVKQDEVIVTVEDF